MGLFDRISRLFRANVNSVVAAAEDPAKLLDQAIIDMEEDLIRLKEAVATAIASEKRTGQQVQNNKTQRDDWQGKAQLALQKGNDNLAREALARKKTYDTALSLLEPQWAAQQQNAEKLKQSLLAMEAKIQEAKLKKEQLKGRAQAAKAQEDIQKTLSGLGTSGAMAAFERMEEKVLQQEAKAQAGLELAGADLDSQFAQLEAGSIDDELAQMKAQLFGETAAPALEPGTTQALPSESAVDRLSAL